MLGLLPLNKTITMLLRHIKLSSLPKYDGNKMIRSYKLYTTRLQLIDATATFR